MALRGQAKLLQGFAIELVNDGFGLSHETHEGGPVEIIPIHMAVILHVVRQFVKPVAAIVDIGLELIGIDGPPALGLAVLAAKPCERPKTRGAFMVHDVVGIAAGITRRAIGPCHAGKAEPGAQVQQDGLKGPHIAVRFDHGLADGIGGAIGFGNRPVEHRNAVPALEIGCIRQDEIGVVHHLGIIGIGIDDARDDIFAIVAFGGERLQRVRHIHGRVPAHVGHVHEEKIDSVGIALGRVVDHHVHEAVGGERRIPGIGLVDAQGLAVFIHQQIIGADDETQGRAGHGRVGPDLPQLARGPDGRRYRLWEMAACSGSRRAHRWCPG